MKKLIVVVLIAIVCFGITVAIVIAINPPVAVSSPSSEETGGSGALSAPVRHDGTVMSVAEFQTWMAKRGYYHGKIDGKVSKDYINSLTQTAWDKAYCDQCGVEDMKVAMRGE